MALVTLYQAKKHLKETTDDRDDDIMLKTEQASAIILDYLKSRGDTNWTDVNVPKPVQSATLLMLGHLDANRGDDMKADADVWLAIERLLMRHRDPALA